jgi:hypothetical protein
MEQELAEVLVRCLTACEVRNESSSARRTATIMHDFEHFIETSLHQSLLLPELCAAIGVLRTHPPWLLRCRSRR